jgi:hypothetical protein
MTLEPSAFLDKAAPPDTATVEAVLGDALEAWDRLRGRLDDVLGPLQSGWSFSGKAHGWSLRLRRGDRAVVYLTPLAGRFRASLAIPERSVAEALEVDLPAAVRAIIAAAPSYPEGRAIRLDVADEDDLEAVVSLARIRMTG